MNGRSPAAPLRAVVVGVGRIGELHAQIYADDPRTELVGVIDADSESARAVAEQLGVPWFDDVEELLRNSRPQLASVAVPEGARPPLAIRMAAAGVDLLLEKPLSPSLGQTDALVAELAPFGRVVGVNFIVRHDPRYRRVVSAVRSGELGDVVSLSSYRRGTAAARESLRQWTGLLISTAVHDVDAMAWIVGSRVTRVYAEAVRVGDDASEDAVLATLRFENGAIAALDTSWLLPTSAPEPISAGMHVVALGGAASIRGVNHGLALLDRQGLRLPDMANWPVDEVGVGGALRNSVRHFVDCVISRQTPMTGLGEARAAEAVVHALHESLRTGLPQSLADSTP